MNEEKQQELRRLLLEAMENLEIHRSADNPQLPAIINVDLYRMILQQYWTSHSLNDASNVKSYELRIVNEATKSELLDFIREVFAPCIHQDRLQSAGFFITGMGFLNGYPLDDVLKQLLNIAVVHGIERAALIFEKAANETSVSFQYIALLEGVRVEEEIQVFEGVRLVPLPPSTSDLLNYVPDTVYFYRSPHSLVGKTLLIIDASVYPIFHKPFPELFREGFQGDDLPFRAKVGETFPNFKVDDFYKKFCQAVSLVCNSSVQISFKWRFLAEDELCNLASRGVIGISQHRDADLFGGYTIVRQVQIVEAKDLYETLDKLKPSFRDKLQIAIDRWVKSKTTQTPVDKIIDLGIAFESLYLSDRDGNSELSFQLRLRASRFLGIDRAHRKKLMKVFGQIYEWRSKVVHTGKLPNKSKRTPFALEEIEQFLNKAQDLCRVSIMKILEVGQFPDWNSLILD